MEKPGGYEQDPKTLAGSKGVTVFYWVSRQQSIRNTRRAVRHRTDHHWQSGSLGRERLRRSHSLENGGCEPTSSLPRILWSRLKEHPLSRVGPGLIRGVATTAAG